MLHTIISPSPDQDHDIKTNRQVHVIETYIGIGRRYDPPDLSRNPPPGSSPPPRPARPPSPPRYPTHNDANANWNEGSRIPDPRGTSGQSPRLPSLCHFVLPYVRFRQRYELLFFLSRTFCSAGTATRLAVLLQRPCSTTAKPVQ